jgi:hypothetical protein
MFKDNAFLLTILGLTLTITLVIIYVAVQKSNEISAMAEQHGCTYLGKARDLVGVSFYNCNDEIIMKPTGKSL